MSQTYQRTPMLHWYECWAIRNKIEQRGRLSEDKIQESVEKRADRLEGYRTCYVKIYLSVKNPKSPMSFLSSTEQQ